MTTEAEFEEACKRHDLTFEYSDDHSVWQRGCSSLAKLRAMANELGLDKAVPIWNRIVDTKLVADARQQFYWRDPSQPKGATK
jgi:hypothetical protein